jgi:hypothetical protein
MDTVVNDLKLPLGTLALIDTQALFFSVREAFGEAKRTDFLKLRHLIEDSIKDDPPHSYLDLKAYVVKYPKFDTSNFKQMLHKFSYSVEEKLAFPVVDGKHDTSWSSGIVADAVQKNRYNRYIFVTGDGNIIRAVETLKGVGKQVWAASLPANLNPTLAKIVDKVIILDDKIIWKVEQKEASA